MTTVLTRLELGDTDGHPFHGNQYTGGMGGDGDGKAGGSIRGDVGNRALRNAMAAGLEDAGRKFGDSVYDPTDENYSLIEATESMRQAAKAEVVAAAGADIAQAAVEDPAVRAEMEAQYGAGTDRYGAVSDGFNRDALGTDWLDRQYGAFKDPSEMTNEQLYGEIKAQDYVDSWSTSAADSNETSLALQQAAAETVDAHSSSFDDYLSNGMSGNQAWEQEENTMKAFVQGEYDRTQAFLKDNGITEVTLHRGFNSPTPYAEEGPQPISMNPASSWSVDRSTAVDFADTSDSGATSYVLTMTVPASDIISTARTGQGALHEGEVIVRNQPGAVAYVSAPSAEYDGLPYGGAYIDPPDGT